MDRLRKHRGESVAAARFLFASFREKELEGQLVQSVRHAANQKSHNHVRHGRLLPAFCHVRQGSGVRSHVRTGSFTVLVGVYVKLV